MNDDPPRGLDNSRILFEAVSNDVELTVEDAEAIEALQDRNQDDRSKE